MAGLFKSPELFAALRQAKVDRSQEAESVWQPFEDDRHTAIPVIAGRTATLLKSAHELNGLPDGRTISAGGV